MSYFVKPLVTDFMAETDLSGNAYMPVRIAGGVIVAAGNATSAIIGTLTADVEDGSSDAVSLPVAVGGIAKVKVGSSGATQNTFGTAEATGWTDAATGNFYGCLFLETGASGAIIPAIIVQGQLD